MRENPELVWEVYLSLEDEFLNYIRYVPLVPNHENVWSYPLANLLNNVGSCIDSFFKNAIYCESLDGFEGIQPIRDNEKKQNMKYYREIFDAKYHLSGKKIFELQSLSPVCPFNKWKENTAPIWWNDYTDIKHDRFRNKESATLNSTLEALGGLFLLFLNHKETMFVLVDRDVIKRGCGGGHPKEMCKSVISKGEPFQEILNQMYAKTSLFGYVFEDKYRQNDDNEKRRILSPAYPGY